MDPLLPDDPPTDAILAALRATYQLPVRTLEALTDGKDTAAQAYRATAGDTQWFVKVRRGAAHRPGLAVPGHLHQAGVPGVVAPLHTADGTPCARLDGHTLVAYPYLPARTGMAGGLSAGQWTQFGRTVRRIHTTPLTDPGFPPVPTETFGPAWDGSARTWADARRVAAQVEQGAFTDPLSRDTAAFWRARADRIRALIDKAERLADRVRAAHLPPVLCHADLHTGNVLVDAEQRLWIVDWDEVVLAPAERDLMFVLGGGISRSLVSRAAEEHFRRGYGPTDANPVALAYYRTTWAVQDIASYGEQVFTQPAAHPAERNDAARILRGLFDPGDTVDLAERDAATI